MTRTDADTFYEIARAALNDLPEPFRAGTADVVLRVEDWAPRRILEEMGIDDPLELTGLYEGIPLTEKSVTYPSPYPDTVWLFRKPILEEWRERQVDLTDLITHVVVHEIAHHFGWSDEDIAVIDPWWE
ncbi:metallopeptidase family protein [Sagittula sp. MA-2]|jgi:predicted Zn-dependent protease with MMP-like domain|uniref:metallopeptidase family protein n=1 Tax=Sagittula sp. MA-2 TaxID=3048007 RepID=UPI0024C2B1C6|nr:metallopeptidase family protein [Sagittula sp. MA-2]WHZ35117.1 metallopeptidase family protein [Sagittula sp. MA-2]